MNREEVVAQFTFEHATSGLSTRDLVLTVIDQPTAETSLERPRTLTEREGVGWPPEDWEERGLPFDGTELPPPVLSPPPKTRKKGNLWLLEGIVAKGRDAVGAFTLTFDFDGGALDIAIDMAVEERQQGFGHELADRMESAASKLGLTRLTFFPTNTAALAAGLGLGFTDVHETGVQVRKVS